MIFRYMVARDRGDLKTATQYLERYLRHPSSPTAAWTPVQNLLFALGRHERAVAVGEHALLVEPICGPCYDALIRDYFFLRQFEHAVAIHAQAENLGIEMPANNWYAAALLFSGDAEVALAEYRRDGIGTPARLAGSAMAFHALGQMAEYEQALAELNEFVRTQPGAMSLAAMVYAFVGDNDRAFEALNGVPRLGPAFASDPQFDGLREHPRYEELLEQAGIWPEDPRDEIEFNFELPE